MSVKLRTPYVITLLEVASPPAAEPGIVKLYAIDAGGGNVELFIRDADGNESQVTDAGTITAGALLTATGIVTVSSAAAPSIGQALIATSATTATWQEVSSLQLTSTPPVAVDAAAAVLGVATTAAKGDHKHSVSTGAPSGLTVGGSNVTGTSNNLSRADHGHSLPAFGATAGTFAQGDDARFTNDRTASGLRSLTTVVSVSGATAPSAGQALVATSSTVATWQAPTATALATTGASVVVNTAAPPTSGQVLTAVGATSANWQTPTGGGGGGSSFPYYAFDLTRGNTDQTSADEIANTLFNSTGLTGVVRFVAVIECATSGQTATLELYNVTDGATVSSVSTSNTTATRVSTAVLSLPGGEKLYGARLSRTGGTLSDRVTCRLARFENTAV